MLPSHHAASAVLAGAALRARGWSWVFLASFAAGAVLVDVDHYVSYVWQTGDLSLLRAYRYHRSRVPALPARRLAFRWRWPGWTGDDRPFHGGLFLAPLVVAAIAAGWLRPLALGVLLHRLLDFAWESFWQAQ